MCVCELGDWGLAEWPLKIQLDPSSCFIQWAWNDVLRVPTPTPGPRWDVKAGLS